MAYKEIQIPLGSSNVQSVSYDEETSNLQIEFIKGTHPYIHAAVPSTVADGFTTSGLSAGKYYNAHIKGQYPLI